MIPLLSYDEQEKAVCKGLMARMRKAGYRELFKAMTSPREGNFCWVSGAARLEMECRLIRSSIKQVAVLIRDREVTKDVLRKIAQDSMEERDLLILMQRDDEDWFPGMSPIQYAQYIENL